VSRPPPNDKRAPRALRAGNCSEEARHISTATGLTIVEVENLLRAGRTREELLVLAERRRKA
jgi:hypothetical protein